MAEAVDYHSQEYQISLPSVTSFVGGAATHYHNEVITRVIYFRHSVSTIITLINQMSVFDLVGRGRDKYIQFRATITSVILIICAICGRESRAFNFRRFTLAKQKSDSFQKFLLTFGKRHIGWEIYFSRSMCNRDTIQMHSCFPMGYRRQRARPKSSKRSVLAPDQSPMTIASKATRPVRTHEGPNPARRPENQERFTGLAHSLDVKVISNFFSWLVYQWCILLRA